MVFKTKNEDFFLRCLLIVSWLAIQLYYYQIAPAFQEMEIVDTDSYMRLVRVEELAKTGDWYDSTIERSNAPFGDNLHWTRPFDMLLLAGAWIGTPIWGFSQALLNWGIIINPLLGALSLFIIHWVVSPFVKTQGQRLFELLLFTQYATWETFSIGHPDHHGLLLLLFMVELGLLFRMLNESLGFSSCRWAGVIAAIALWVSIESLTMIIVVFGTIGFLWIRSGGSFLKRLRCFNLFLFLSCLVILVIERPLPNIFLVEFDKISIVHVFVFFLSLVGLVILGKLPQDKMRSRLIAPVPVGFVALMILWAVFPDFFRGPFVQVNKDIVPIWLNKVREVQPLFSTGQMMILILTGSFLLSIFSVWLMRGKKPFNKLMIVPLLIGLLVFVPLTVYQIRWYRYAGIIMVLLMGPSLVFLMEKISTVKPVLKQRLLRIVTILLFCLGPLVLGLAVETIFEEPEAESRSCRTVKPLCLWFNDHREDFSAGSTVLAFIDFGPEILYRTDFQVIATPYHRNDQGILFNYQVMSSPDDDQAYQMIKERGVDLIVLCPDSAEKTSYGKKTPGTTFYSRILKGNLPVWLQPVELPPDLQDKFKVFKVSLPLHDIPHQYSRTRGQNFLLGCFLPPKVR